MFWPFQVLRTSTAALISKEQQRRKASPYSLCFLPLSVCHFISFLNSFKRQEAYTSLMDAFFSLNLFQKFPFIRSRLRSQHLFCIAGFELLRANVSGSSHLLPMCNRSQYKFLNSKVDSYAQIYTCSRCNP